MLKPAATTLMRLSSLLLPGLLLAGPALKADIDPDLAIYYRRTLRQIAAHERHPKDAYGLLKEHEALLPQEYWPEQAQFYLLETTQKLGEHYGKTLGKAEELFAATLYEEAIPLYEEIWSAIEGRSFPESGEIEEETCVQALCRLGQANFHLGRYQEAIRCLELNHTRSEKLPVHLQYLKRQCLYLLAVSYRHRGDYEQAIRTLQTDELQASLNNLSLHDDVNFELGLNRFLEGKLLQAREHFESVSSSNSEGQIQYLAKLYLARLDLSQRDLTGAEKKLAVLDQLIADGDVLRYELDYLRGETFFQQGDYVKAAGMFERCLPQKNHTYAPWHQETLYNRGWCYLKLIEDSSKTAAELKKYADCAEESFKNLLQTSKDERVYLALAQCYLARARKLQEEECYQKADSLLSQQELYLTHEAKTQAILLRAEAASTYEARDLFYKQLTHKSNNLSPFYAKGWYLKGLNDFEEGQRLRAQEPEKARQAFERSAKTLRKAFSLLKESDPEKAALALKYQILAYSHLETKEGYQKALTTLEQYFSVERETAGIGELIEEMGYLHGLIAVRLVQISGTHLQRNGMQTDGDYAEKILKQFIVNFPKSSFKPEALSLLGSYHFENEQYALAEEYYRQLSASCFPPSAVGTALYWLAACAEKLNRGEKVVKEYRRALYENYPESPVAAAAYFQYYTYSEYLQGDRPAMKHLQSFAQKFPDSPLLINSYYLIGLDYKRDRKTAEGKWVRKKKLMEAIEAFLESETVFDNLYAAGNIPADQLTYYAQIRYRSILERAMANLAIADESLGAKRDIYLQYAEDVFKEISHELSNPENPIVQELGAEHPLGEIQEEGAYWLAVCYEKAGNDQAAQEVIARMMEKYRTVNKTDGYYLSRILYEQAKIFMRQGEYSRAWEVFLQAENANKDKYLSVDQKLDLWIQQSQCCRELNQMEKAMLILSKVINNDAVSSLRVKAMYLRAEIYELQGRHELARKQLEATSKKGGEWGQKAKLKLGKDYGYQ